MGASPRRRSVRHSHPQQTKPGDVVKVSRRRWKSVADANAKPMWAGRTIEIDCRAGRDLESCGYCRVESCGACVVRYARALSPVPSGLKNCAPPQFR